MKKISFIGCALFILLGLSPVYAEDPYVEPGSLRFSHELTLEGVIHKARPGWVVTDDGLNKLHTQRGQDENPWKTEWGQSLLTEVATRLSPDVFGRLLFEAQGDYADRFWRPVNIEHHKKEADIPVFVRQAEARVDRDTWHLHGFHGVGHGNWAADGDFFELYPAAYPEDGYMGSSSSFGVYPERWSQDFYLNISRRHVPRGFEAGGDWKGLNAAVAYGSELQWGYDESVYARVSLPVSTSKFTFAFKDEDVPYSQDLLEEERNNAYALTWDWPTENGHRVQAGVLYNPFRVGRSYQVARETPAGSGLLGSSTDISQKTSNREDAVGARLRLERRLFFFNRDWQSALDMSHLGLLAGNKEEIGFDVGTDITNLIRGIFQYTYRRPIEGPIPFLYEGTPDNIGAVAANPRGPESPFTVDWDNREAVYFLTTLSFDPTAGSNLFLYDNRALSNWNVNPQEDAGLAFALQHRASDYRTPTDRMYYYDVNGNIVWEPAGRSGAWASEHALHEFRLLSTGRLSEHRWLLGLAGGQAPAFSSLAYGNGTAKEKSITEYVSFEARWEGNVWDWWGHYGTGVWGPEKNTHPFFGFAFDRLWGLGLTYKITGNTSIDVDYLAARQDDNLFVAPDLGSYDEIRTMFTHRFGFLFQFKEPSRPGYKAR